MAIKGSLREASLADVVQLLFLGRRTGCLSVANERNFGSIWFDDGWITFAGMVSRPDRLGERLLAAGRLRPEQLAQAIAVQQAMPGQRLGAVLRQLGYLTPEDVEGEVRRQVEETIYTLFTWTSGTFSFEAGVRPEEPEAALRLNPDGLLLEGARRVDEWSVIAKKIPSLDAVFALEGDVRGGAEGDEALVETERRLLPLLDGIRTARDLMDTTGLTDFEVCRVLYGLLSAGRLRRVATAPAAPPRESGSRLDEHRNLGIAFYRTGMLAEADREFRRVAELRPENGEGPFHLGLIALREARWEEAITQLKLAAERSGPRPAVLHNLALAFEALGRLDEADAALSEAIQREKDDPRLWIGWGLLALRRAQGPSALERFARARDLIGTATPPARWYWGCGCAQALSEAWQDSLATVREGVTQYPDHPVLRTSLGVLLEASGEVGEAEAHLRHALGEDPTIPQISKNLGDLLYRAGRWDEAEEAYLRAAKLAPALGDDLFFKLGNLACRRADMPTARQHWEEAVRLNPEHALARANLSGSRAGQ
ncbi:MAG: tetratricopeptide repeat protein [Gemmatimonadetes bacterium]|jgi:tetratricopeptide (TPR) repeat protein|nr:tetratricopeptide repeat protein [Gemmatimonadota bacterium]MBK9548952.1 tetratricopeptide repeat protein [Gemmatimonadota bacterium]MBP6443688.1 tetratricopeptide repeat protein [Gemmatimonadales bacterium]MBP7620680.1 tetratricopeptide repeat protein [Gemmatimonadales bacterium]